MLRAIKQDEQFFACRSGLPLAFRIAPVLLLCASTAAYQFSASTLARVLLAVALAGGMLCAVPTFHIYTPKRSQVYRYAKWPVLLGAFWLANRPVLRLVRCHLDLGSGVRLDRLGLCLPPAQAAR